ncbi:MAG: polyprenyl diphosphate synthase [Patescibacteria group bacterium]
MAKKTTNGFTKFPKVPQHVAIICDGNRRWARQQGLMALMGHRKAMESVFEPIIDRAQGLGVQFLTFWVFSTENWKRDQAEVDGLLNLFREAFDTQAKKLAEKGARIKVIGDIADFAEDVQERIMETVRRTEKNTGITVVFAMNYGGRDEMVRAMERLMRTVQESIAAGKKAPQLTAGYFSQFLDTAGTPDPELIIRTSGEQRLSGFLPWQSEYAEFAFPKFHFPEFTAERFEELIADFAQRGRRFGQ